MPCYPKFCDGDYICEVHTFLKKTADTMIKGYKDIEANKQIVGGGG